MMGKRRSSTEADKPTFDEPHRVFVSHATADKWIATRLCEQIESTGATTFRDDRDIDGGDDIPKRLRAEIERSREMVVLLTPESYDRPWVLIEVGAGWFKSEDFRIVAILCHVAFERIPDMLKSKKAIPLNDMDQYLEELAQRVRGRHD